MQETSSDLFPSTIRLSISAGQLPLEVPMETSTQWTLRLEKKSGGLGMKGKVFSPPAVAGTIAYFGSHDGYLHALDVRSGEETWRFKTAELFYGSPVVDRGTVCFGDHNGVAYAVR